MKVFTTLIAIGQALVLLACCSTIPPPVRSPTSIPSTGQSLDKRIDYLTSHITEDHNILHAEVTPAGDELISLGPRVIAPTLRLMLSDDIYERMCAERVLAEVTSQMFGYRPGNGWPNDTREANWRTFWSDMGNLDSLADRPTREAGVQSWRKWIDLNMPLDYKASSK